MPKDFLNTTQQTKLKKHWDVKPKGFYLSFRREDFKSDVAWEATCEIAGVNPDTTVELKILSFGTYTK